MVCLYCGGKTQVVNSRPQKRLNGIWRRRECTACQAVFTSVEAVDYAKSIIVRAQSGDLAPFERDKLFLSIHKACEHRRTARSDAGALCDTIIAQVLAAVVNGSLDAQVISAVTTETLARFDPTAATLYRARHTS